MPKIATLFKKIWLGIRVAEPYLEMAGRLLPPPFGVIIIALDALIDKAELAFPASGSGAQKAEFFSAQGLKVMEILTGKNVDNPKTRAIVARIGTTTVQIKDIEAQVQQLRQQYADIVKELKDAIESAKDAAIDDAP